MQRNIMECCSNLIFFQISDQFLAFFQIFCFNIKHMSIMHTIFRNNRKFDLSGILEFFQCFIISVPCVHTVVIDLLRFLKLRPKISCIQLTWKIRRTCIHPCIFINLATEEFTSVCTFFSDNLSSLNVLRVTDQKCSTFSHTVILCLMETETSVITDGSKCFSFVGSHHSLSCVFDYFQIIFLCNRTDLIHVTGHAGIVNRNDCFCLLCDCILNQSLVDIHCLRTDIYKYRLRSP